MEIKRAREILFTTGLEDEGSFYGPAAGLSVGTGLIFRDIAFPLYDDASKKFRVQAGLATVLSHECDLDPANDRFLNGMALICPILTLEAVVREAAETSFSDVDLGAFLGHVARRRTPRCVYFPPLPDRLPFGGLLNLNLIASTSASLLTDDRRVAALSARAHRAVTVALGEHLIRPKAETLPFSDSPATKSRSIVG
jgi:hypothetical protein